jgi:magnesium chelatase subunit H
MPAPVKLVLNKLFGTSSREEDKLAGYLKLLKIGPKLLDLIPNMKGLGKLNGLKTWIRVYAFWTESGVENIVSMLKIMVKDLELDPSASSSDEHVDIPIADISLVETPPLGLFHPLLKESGIVMSSPKKYVEWYTQKHPWVTDQTPRVGVLLYRKHVISEQGYLGNLINLMENEGLNATVFLFDCQGFMN